MKNLFLFCFLFCFFCLFSACKKEKSCPAFTMDDIVEFTYKEPDTISFRNESDEIFQVFISQINYSLPYTFECRDRFNVCPCTNYAEALATDTKTSVPYAFLRMEQSDLSEMQYFIYNVQGFEFEFDFINELPYIEQMDHLQYFMSLAIGDAVYGDVIVITNSDNTGNDIYQVYFNKRNGVLCFIEKSTGTIWDIIN